MSFKADLFPDSTGTVGQENEAPDEIATKKRSKCCAFVLLPKQSSGSDEGSGRGPVNNGVSARADEFWKRLGRELGELSGNRHVGWLLARKDARLVMQVGIARRSISDLQSPAAALKRFAHPASAKQLGTVLWRSRVR